MQSLVLEPIGPPFIILETKEGRLIGEFRGCYLFVHFEILTKWTKTTYKRLQESLTVTKIEAAKQGIKALYSFVTDDNLKLVSMFGFSPIASCTNEANANNLVELLCPSLQ